MKQAIYLIALFTTFVLSSCTKGYTHEKIVTNNTRNDITVLAGSCCGDDWEYVIAPGESETVFICKYQQPTPPKTEELNWYFTVIHGDQETDLSDPKLWENQSYECIIKYEYTVNGSLKLKGE